MCSSQPLARPLNKLCSEQFITDDWFVAQTSAVQYTDGTFISHWLPWFHWFSQPCTVLLLRFASCNSPLPTSKSRRKPPSQFEIPTYQLGAVFPTVPKFMFLPHL